MVVAVVAVGVVQVPVHEVVHMVAVGHGFMSAAGAMHVARLVPGACVRGRADVRVGGGDGDAVLVHMVAVGVVQVAVVQIVSVSVMDDGSVTAAGAVSVIVIGVLGMGAGAHGGFLKRGKRI